MPLNEGDVAYALWRGPDLVCEGHDANFLEVAGRDDIIGVRADELFPSERGHVLVSAMAGALQRGLPQHFPTDWGLISFVPLAADLVVARLEAGPRPIPQRRARPSSDAPATD